MIWGHDPKFKKYEIIDSSLGYKVFFTKVEYSTQHSSPWLPRPSANIFHDHFLP